MPTIEISPPVASYTQGGVYAHVQFSWRVAGSHEWTRKSYSPKQADLSAYAPSNILALSPGYWGDAEVRADVQAKMTADFGFTTFTFLGSGA